MYYPAFRIVLRLQTQASERFLLEAARLFHFYDDMEMEVLLALPVS
jgi:hypothetical protein